VARDIELDGGNLSWSRALVDTFDQRNEIVAGEAADRNDSVLPCRSRKILFKIRIQADIAPTECIHPAAVDPPQCLLVKTEHCWELCQLPIIAQCEVAFARLKRHRPGRHRPER